METPRRRRWLFPTLILVGVLPWIANCTSAPGYQGPVSDHFDGQRFAGRRPLDKGLTDVLRWKMTSEVAEWPASLVTEPQTVPPALLDSDAFFVTFINHATALIQIGGKRILTDPIFSERSSPFTWAGPKRVRAPGVRFEDLPPIDIVIISHNHYDHLDIPSLERLAARDDPLIIAGLGNSLLLEQRGLRHNHDMDWDEELRVDNLSFRFLYCQHWSGRGLTDRCKTLWGSFLVRSDAGESFYFAGDTGYSPHFREQREAHGAVDLALLPIGAYEPRWFMRYQHMNPAEAVTAHGDLGAKRSMGIHFGTFQLTDEAIDEPVRALERARAQVGLSEREFWAPEFGQTTVIREAGAKGG